MSRLADAFASRRGATGLIPYLTAGYPSLEVSLALMREFERRGATALEVGIPFSDPIADGPDIQRASERALALGVGPRESLELIRRYREGGTLPIVVMTYLNPVFRMGIESFAALAREVGVDGALISDLPADEAPEVWSALDRAGLDTVLLIAPTTSSERLPALVARCRGFVYCLSRTGVTGRSGGYSGSLPERVVELRRLTPLPIAVGFGISDADSARPLRGVADAVVVGAALMRAAGEGPESGAVERAGTLFSELLAALT